MKATKATDTDIPLAHDIEVEDVAPGVFTIGGAGRSLVVETPDGLLLVDAGATRPMVQEMQRTLRARTGAPVRWIVYSHGHLGYNYGVGLWLKEAEQLGHPRPVIVAHENLVRRYRRYAETTGLQNHINALQFRGAVPTLERLPLTYPDLTYTGSYTVHAGPDRTVQLLWAPSETDDATAVWLPEEKVLYGGAAVIDAIPNVGTPLRTLRDPVRWADTLDRLAALGAQVLVPEFGPVARGREAVDAWLREPAAVLRWLRREVVERMNRGMTVGAILHDIDYPDGMFDKPWLKETYGHRDYLVRDVYRSENGWWEERNPTSLHPAHPDAAATAIADAITDKQAVLDHATQLHDQGHTQEALHVIDLLALAPADHPHHTAARTLKRHLCAALAEQSTSYISQSIYANAARRSGPAETGVPKL
ncbi:alkyl sulfatase dimerization domain-containing protein [Streptomyces sp. NPDC017979]|uniref:alkyl sulfatase dimerization domain-containing protein n=1 Tax=Streptomyces sp. NPDC017979 TaxID=3365024 RepID=UPI003797EA4D